MADFWARVILVIGAIGSAFAFWKVTKAGIEKDKENEINSERLESEKEAAQDAKEDLESIRNADDDEYLKRVRDSER